MRLRAQSAVLLGEPVIILVQPDTVSVTSRSGELMSADTVATAVEAAGGRTLTLPPDFSGVPADGWEGYLAPGTDEARLYFPSGRVLYDGTMPTTSGWVDQVGKAGSVVVCTGPMATVADFEAVLMAGRVLWVRVPFTIG